MILSDNKIKLYFIVFLAICVVCSLAYFNSLTNPFIWDDQALVVKNTLIRSPQNLGLSFTNDLFFGETTSSNYYRPLQTISYIFDYYFWRLNPLGYHLSNIILQINVSFLFFLLAFNLSTSLAISVSAAILFAASPVHTEVVTYISGRAETLMAFFVILALLLFIRSQNKESKQGSLFYFLSLVSFGLSLLSKELAIVFPLIICGYIFYFLRDKLKDRAYFLKIIFPFFTISLIYLFLRFPSLSFATLGNSAVVKYAWYVRLIVLPKIIFTYLKLLILPTGLHMSWELARPTTYAGILFLVSWLGLIIVGCCYLLRYSAKNKVASFILFWSLVFFIPQSGIFPINAFVAEHFIYLPSISFFMLLTYVSHKVLRKEIFVLSLVLLCVFYVVLTAGRNFEWRSPIVFYKNIIKFSRYSFQAHNNLGMEYEHLGRFAEAEREYKRALEIKPDLAEARFNMAQLHFKLKLYSQAKSEYELLEKIALGAKAAEVENNLGNIYEVAGNLDGAIERYNQALRLNPGLKFTHFNLARIYFVKKEPRAAVEQILASLDLSDKNNPALRKIIEDFFSSSGYAYNITDFYNNLGINFAKHNYWLAAVSAFSRALDLDPGSCDYYYNLGLTYLNLGEKSKARNALKQTLRINPNHIKGKRLIEIIK
jgi:protein O-mannosyl-transferase